MLSAIFGVHLVCAAVALGLGRVLGRRVWFLCGFAPLTVLVWLTVNAGAFAAATPISEQVDWVEQLGLTFELRVDAFGALMLVLIAGIGLLVTVYGWHYFGDSPEGPRAAAMLALFAGAMVGVVVADNLLALFVFWELTSITSYLLIGLQDTKTEARAAAQHALLLTGLGGLVMLAGLVLLGQQAGTFTLSDVLETPPSGSSTAVALVLILVGAFTKSAQYPFHSWLPGAMVAPTPISAYLHSAAMVKAGVYLVARLAPAFATVGPWRPLVITVGLVTMVAGGLRAFRPFDLKQLLAFGTISQLGFLMVLFGIGQPAATAAGCALLLAHGAFKASLFMVVGIVDHETNTRDVRHLPMLATGWGLTKAAALISAASMAAIPPLAGFLAKEQAYAALLEGSGVERLVLAGIVVGSVLTVAYSIRFAMALVRPDTITPDPTTRARAAHRPSHGFLAPALLLAVASVVLGAVPGLWSGLVDSAARSLDGAARAHLELWHGVSAPLMLSILTLALGAGVFACRRPIAAVQRALAPRFSGQQVYDGTVRLLLRAAALLTGIVQPGSLPVYVAVILSTAAVLPVAALVVGGGWPGWSVPAFDSIAYLPVAAILVVGAIAATVAQRRFAAVLLLGVVGYGMTLLFLIRGAPDLAVTQFGVETLFVAVFLLVLRRLPARFERRDTNAGRVFRFGVASVVGVFVVVMALTAGSSRTAEPVSHAAVELAYPEGFGRNVVNVILVDLRGLDTLGEVSVLVAAALGIVALARTGRRPRPRPHRRSRPSVEQESAA